MPPSPARRRPRPRRRRTPALAQDAATPPSTKSAKGDHRCRAASAWRDLVPNRFVHGAAAGRVVIELAPVSRPSTWRTSRPWPKAGSGTDWRSTRSQGQLRRPMGRCRRRRQKDQPFRRRPRPPAGGIPSARQDAPDRLPDADSWARRSRLHRRLPHARAARAGKAWIAHCYGVVGADLATPDSLGAGLYAIIGQAPRARWIPAGRGRAGGQTWAAQRGAARPGPMGFYEKPEQRRSSRSSCPGGRTHAAAGCCAPTARPSATPPSAAQPGRRFLHRPAGHIDLYASPAGAPPPGLTCQPGGLMAPRARRAWKARTRYASPCSPTCTPAATRWRTLPAPSSTRPATVQHSAPATPRRLLVPTRPGWSASRAKAQARGGASHRESRRQPRQ